MAQSRPRHDVYGQPLPPLRDASHESRITQHQNPALRRFLLALLNEHLDALMCRGTYGELHVRCQVQNGLLMGQFTIGVEQHYRPHEDE